MDLMDFLDDDDDETPEPGTILWTDLTVKDARKVCDFYASVVGWEVEEVEMDGYADYTLSDSSGEPVAGLCHARGPNAGLPAQWIVYIGVEDLDASLARCKELGGKVLRPVRKHEDGRFAVIQDPAGAVCALYQSGA